MTRTRANGSGPMRIGSTIEFSEDLYSMFYVTTFKSEFIYFNKKIAKIANQDNQVKKSKIYEDLKKELEIVQKEGG
jgi:hypothetical protein